MSEPEFEFTDADPLPTVVDDPDIAFSGFTQVSQDTARFLRHDFPKPYLAIPGGRRFTWPVGVEGFEINEEAEVAQHKYLGDIDLDVDITHRGAETIVMTGVFPGWSSTDHMNALRAVFFAVSPQQGKVLSLPLILPTVTYVVCQSLRHSHASDDRTQDIEYSMTMLKVATSAAGRSLSASGGSGTTSDTPGGSSGGSGVQPAPSSGSSGSYLIANSNVNTLRKMASQLQGTPTLTWETIYELNRDFFDSRNVPSHQIPDYPIPPGTKIVLP